MAGMSDAEMKEHQEHQKQQARQSPTFAQTALAGSHCGAGCTLADVINEFSVFAAGVPPCSAPSSTPATCGTSLSSAWLLGVLFQYFTIKPMRNLSVGAGVWAAVKADTLSILTFQVGMYAWMALVYFKLFPAPHLHPTSPATS